MKKKILSLVMAAALTAGLIAGCGSKPQDAGSGGGNDAGNAGAGQQEQTEQPQTGGEAKESGDVVNLVLAIRGAIGNAREQEIIDAMNAYSAEKIGVTITFLPTEASEYVDTIARYLAAKDDIDICFMASYTGLVDLARQGALMDLTEYVHSPEYEKLYGVMPENIWEGSLIDGKYYCVPNYKESAIGFDLMTPKALADTIKEKYGIDFNAIECHNMWDLANFEEYVEAAKQEGVSYPVLDYDLDLFYWMQSDDRYEWVDFASNIPIVHNRETHELSLVYENEDFLPYFELIRSWNKKGYYNEEELLDGFQENLILQSGDYGLASWTSVPDNQQSACDMFGTEVYLNEFDNNYITQTSVLGSTWAIASYSSKADAAMKWIELVETDTKFADLFVYGIEGTDYTRDEDGRIVDIPDSGWNNYTWKVTSYETASVLNTKAEDYKEQYTQFNDAAKISDIAGFRAVYDGVESEKAALQALQVEIQDLYYMGFYGPDNLEDTIAKCKAAGSDAMIEKLQAQLDEYLAADR